MLHSETIAKLAAALVKAQSEMPSVTKNATNPAFRSKFANLDAIVDTVKPVLAKHELGIFQSIGDSPTGTVRVETMLIHSSGEWLMSGITMPVAKNDPQGVGSAITYGRRYGLSAALSLATDEDDDANAASKPARAKEEGSATARAQTRVAAAQSQPAPIPSERIIKGKRLSEYTTPELSDMVKALRAEGTDKHKQLLGDLTTVLNDRVLGPSKKAAQSGDDTARVQLMKQGVEREDADLGIPA